MYKNILILGSSRTGKTTLSRLINKTYGYSIVNLDDIVSVFEKFFPDLHINHNSDENVCATNFADFLTNYLEELSNGPNFYNGNKFVIEGTHIDFSKLLDKLDKSKYYILGLVYNNISSTELYTKIKEHDTEDDWTYYLNDDILKKDVDYFLKRNQFFYQEFKKYDIETFDISIDRDKVLNEIVYIVEDRCKLEEIIN